VNKYCWCDPEWPSVPPTYPFFQTVSTSLSWLHYLYCYRPTSSKKTSADNTTLLHCGLYACAFFADQRSMGFKHTKRLSLHRTTTDDICRLLGKREMKTVRKLR
jgi:hypothetical protein